jgi:hypothetical protein
MPASPLLIQSTPGIRRDGTRFDADFYNDGQWVRFQRGKPRKMWGYRAIQNAISQIPRKLSVFSRAGYHYLAAGSGAYCEQFTINSSGSASVPVNRTPTLAFTVDSNNTWQFDYIYDTATNNDATILAHAAPNLLSIDNNVERPIFYGPATGSGALTPLALPVLNTQFQIATFTGTLSSGSAVVTAVSSTANLTTGMQVSGTGLTGTIYIKSIDSSTQITLSANASGSGAQTITAFVGGVSGGLMTLFPYVMAFSSNGAVQWCAPGKPNDWWSTGSGFAYVTDQKIVAGRIARAGPGYSPSGLLWSLNALIRVYFTGGTGTWGFDTISDDVTILSSNGIVEYDGVFFWAGTDRFFMYSGNVRELPNDMSTNWFFDNLNYAQRQKVFAFKNTRWGEIWWCYPRGTATECTHAIIYNVRENCWYDTQLPNSGRSCGLGPGVFPYPLLGGVDIDPNSAKYLIWQHETGLDEVNGSNTYPIYSFFETADFNMMSQPQNASNNALEVLIVEPDFVQTANLTLYITGNETARGPTRTSAGSIIKPTVTSPQDAIVRLKEARRQMRFKFVSNALGGDYQMGKMFAHIQPTDARITT